jgi:hypothetical protein
MKKAEIIDIANNVTSKKGNKGSIITILVDGEENIVWSNDPQYTSAYRDIKVTQTEDGYWKMRGNFITKAEAITLRAQAQANAFADAPED